MSDNLPAIVPASPASVVPSGSEMNNIFRVADALAASNMVPQSYQRRPDNIVVAALTGRTWNLDVMVAMRAITVIQGTPTLKPEFMLALIRKAGHSVTGETTASGAWVEGTRADTGDTMRVEFSEADAKLAGLLGKGNWKTYPAAMFWARAVSKLGRMLFSDVLLGASYTAEELGGVAIDDDDEPIVVLSTQGVTAAAAKKQLMAACNGDKDLALAIWTNSVQGKPDRVSDEQLVDLLADAADAAITDAEVVSDDTSEDVPHVDAVEADTEREIDPIDAYQPNVSNPFDLDGGE